MARIENTPEEVMKLGGEGREGRSTKRGGSPQPLSYQIVAGGILFSQCKHRTNNTKTVMHILLLQASDGFNYIRR